MTESDPPADAAPAAETPRRAPPSPRPEQGADLVARPLADLMTPDPVRIAPDATVAEAATLMAERGISCVLVAGSGGPAQGILTVRDLAGRVLARGLDGTARVSDVMSAPVKTLPPDALGADALVLMTERRLSHVPVAAGDRLLGIVTQTDLIRAQGLTAGHLIGAVHAIERPEDLPAITARLPELLALLVGSGARPHAVTRLVTDVADAATRRLLALAEAALGPAPVPWAWLACGSQGRQEQTGVSDQDNVLILSPEARPEHDAHFAELARFVSDGLDAAGWVHCPGDMMATNPRWRRPLPDWRSMFAGWVRKPNPEAQMLASVMFDLRPIAGDATLFEGLHAETLEAASRNSIFLAHMTSNALKHAPPLGLFGGLHWTRKGGRPVVDLKLGGAVPVTDLARLYAMQARILPVSTRARLLEAAETPALSESGGRDLTDAWDFIAETRLRHQARQARRGERPDNLLPADELSEFERDHLRDAFAVVRTLQSAAGQGKAALV